MSINESNEEARKLLARTIQLIGDDPTREGLVDTPDRIIRSWDTLYAGYKQDPADILSKTFSETGKYDEMIVLADIAFFSTCEHHLLPFYGKATVGYIPHERVVGISKLARLVECFARRLQIQERMTTEIAEAIQKHLNPVGVGVVVEAQHLCMVARGVQKQDAVMVTSCLRGVLRSNPETRAEFLNFRRGGK